MSIEKIRMRLLATLEGGEAFRDQSTFEFLAAIAFRGKDDVRIRTIYRPAHRFIRGDDIDFAGNRSEAPNT